MSKIAFIFPGQGSQYVGMGKDFYDSYEEVRELFRLANEVTGLNLEEICFTENEKLNRTEYTQIAMLLVEMSILKVVRKLGVTADMSAGLSLGEYGALAAADVLSDRDLLDLIRKRGIYMQNAYPTGGGMCAILGLETELVEKACEETDGYVRIANYNCPGQLIITGEKAPVTNAAKKCSELGAKKTVELNVSGPFHSSLLKDAADKLAEELKNVSTNNPGIPYVCNVDATEVTNNENIAKLLSDQVISPVKWEQSFKYMLDKGIDTFIEMGPGKTLSGFAKRIDRAAKVISIQTVEDLEKLSEVLNG
ncbi:MAG: ACP S-malonyltransferase [Lachnospiraceae bacterium]|nr:ACP S-malonyltransferase [Lachnospiraceae bacterium]